MSQADEFAVVSGRVVDHLVGSMSVEEAVARVHRAIAFARQNQADRLLINASELSINSIPNTTDRYWAVVNWAEAAGGQLRVAIVARPELIDPDKFGITVAVNRGFKHDIFVNEAEAIAWLDSTSTGA